MQIRGGCRATGIYFEEMLDLASSHIEDLPENVGREAQGVFSPIG
jgi:hypothetical protein